MTIFVLLLVAGGVSVAARALASVRLLAPIALAALASPAFSLGLMAVSAIVEGRPWPADPLGLVLPGAIYDMILAAAIGPLLVSLRARALETERFQW
ncbi:MAG: hypothetical protein C4342_08220 [Armatimonadota bacterium]